MGPDQGEQEGPEHQSAVDKIKDAITSAGSLQFFNSAKPVTIQIDASLRGLGATLIQDRGPVEYRSKLLTETKPATQTSREKC